MIYLTSDLHFGHEAIIEYDNRPFSDVEDMRNGLIRNWNSVVSKTDTVFILGDFSFENRYVTWEIIQALHGHKHLVRGNHDDNRVANPLFWSSVDWYKEVNFAATKFILSHFPIESWNKMSKGTIHAHGHSHGRLREVPNRFDVGTMNWNYCPVPVTELIDRKTNKEVFRPDGTFTNKWKV